MVPRATKGPKKSAVKEAAENVKKSSFLGDQSAITWHVVFAPFLRLVFKLLKNLNCILLEIDK
jgi:hypothetical protein